MVLGISIWGTKEQGKCPRREKQCLPYSRKPDEFSRHGV